LPGGGFLLALREPAKLGQDPLHAATGRVVAGIEIAGVHPAYLDQAALPALDVRRELPDLFVVRQKRGATSHSYRLPIVPMWPDLMPEGAEQFQEHAEHDEQ
jgi:hypothetical protein